MCGKCDTLEADLTVEVLLAEAERSLILAQNDSGESVPHAVRPLSAAEKRAKMRFGEIEALEHSAAEKAAKLLASNAQVYIMAIIGAIFGASQEAEPGAVVDAVDTLTRDKQPTDVIAATEDTQTSMSAILATVYAGAALIAHGEAKRQGVPNIPKPPVPDMKPLDLLARAVALHPWQRLTSKLQSDLLEPQTLAGPALLRPDVEKTLNDIPIDGAVDLAKQAIHSAHGQGRNAAAAAMEPTEIYASELLDGATCDRCEVVDGKDYDTIAEALVEYESGGYGACRGRGRCRGTLVFQYGDVAPNPPEEDTPAPRPKPAPVPKPAAPKAKPAPAPAAKPAKPAGPLDSLPRKKTNPAPANKAEAEAEAWQTNPGYKSGREYQVNCSNSVTAHELRRRGYDVTAAPGAEGRNILKFTQDWWKNPDGTAAMPEFAYTLGGARKKIEAWPDGGRGYVSFEWEKGGGHVISVEKIDGKVVWTEPQRPGQVVDRRYWENMKADTMILTRMDELVPTDKVLQAVKAAE